jgi:hypothetical protein
MCKKKIDKSLKMSIEAIDNFFAIFGFKRVATIKENVIRPTKFNQKETP